MAITTENKRGSNLSGTDGTTNRVLTLSNITMTQAGGFQVFVNGLLLVLTTEYTVSHLAASSTVTFLNLVWNSDYIVVTYVQTAGTPPTTTSYCTYTDVYNKTGLSTTEVASAIVDEMIYDAEAELEMVTGRKFTNANQTTDLISFNDKDLIGNYQSTFLVSHWPVQSVSVCNMLDMDENVVETFDTLSTAEIAAGTVASEDYWLEVMNDATTNLTTTNGKFILKTDTLPKGTNIMKVTYTYGYNSVPQTVKNLAVCLSGIRTWIRFLGGCYNRLNSYSIPQQNVSKGDFYQRGQQNIQMLTEEANRLYDRIGRKARTLFFASGGSR